MKIYSAIYDKYIGMILRVWILGILLIVLLFIFWKRPEGFQNRYTLPAAVSRDIARGKFWSILTEQKTWSMTSDSGSSGGSSGSQTTQQLLKAVMNPGSSDTFKVIFPNYISIYALAKYNMDPVAARYALTNSYDTLQAELVTAAQTPNEVAAGAAFTSEPQQNACTELNALAMSLYGQVLKVSSAVSDLSGAAILSAAVHDENKGMQATSACINQGATPSAACIKLASQDETLFPALHQYDTANVSLLTNGQTVQDMLSLILQTYNGLQCTMPTGSGSLTVSSVFSQTYLDSLGLIDTETLSIKLEELSPYYVSQNLIGYIARKLTATSEFNTHLQSTDDYINDMSKTTNAIVSLNSQLGSKQFYSESTGGIATCPAGYYCPPTSTTPVPCAVGYFCPPGTTALTSENQCPDGTFTPEGKADLNDCNTMMPGGYYPVDGIATICPSGAYCPQGTLQPVPCPNGTYNPTKGKSAQIGGCIACPAGSYCTPSPKGSTYATPCGAGTYSGATNATDKSTCTTCPVGTTCPSAGMPSATPCPAGTYSTSTGNKTTCTQGPSGTYSSQTGATDTSSFLTCPVGYYCPVGAGYKVSCPQGSYCPLPGMSTTIPCPAGRFGNTTNSTNSICDGPCAAGFFCEPGSVLAKQADCPAGNYCPEGTTAPVPCTVGNYCPPGSATPAACPPGTYNNLVGAWSLTACAQCPVGYFCDSGTVTPSLCPVGYFCGLGTAAPGNTMSAPKPCTAGYYCDRAGMSAGTPCPPGTYSASVGATSMTTCIKCAAGLYNSIAGQTSCANICPAGSYCPSSTQCLIYRPPLNGSNNSNSGSNTVSVPIGTIRPISCPIGTYCGSTNMTKPTPCPVGTYSSSVGATALSACQPCTPGTYCPSQGGSVAVTCPVGSYCPNTGASAPNQCPVGATCPVTGMTTAGSGSSR